MKRTSPFKKIRDDLRFISEDIFKNVWAVIDLAGISNDPACDLDPYITKSVNFDGAVRCVRMAKEAGVERYIYSSSCSVYGNGRSTDLDENSPLEPVSLYAKLKAQVEVELLQLQSENFSITILRNATIYGLSPRMRFDLVVNLMTLFAWKNRKIQVLGGGQQWRPLVHLEDVCQAFCLVLEAPSSLIREQIYNVGSKQQNYQVLTIANLIRDVVPYVDVELVPDDPDRRTYNVSFDKIVRDLGFKVTHSVSETAIEIKQNLDSGSLDPNEIRYYTLKFYKYLLDAEKTLHEVSYRGRIF